MKLIGISANGLNDHEKWVEDINDWGNKFGPTNVQFPIVSFRYPCIFVNRLSPFDCIVYKQIADPDRKISTLYDMLDQQDETNRDAKGLPFTVSSHPAQPRRGGFRGEPSRNTTLMPSFYARSVPSSSLTPRRSSVLRFPTRRLLGATSTRSSGRCLAQLAMPPLMHADVWRHHQIALSIVRLPTLLRAPRGRDKTLTVAFAIACAQLSRSATSTVSPPP